MLSERIDCSFSSVAPTAAPTTELTAADIAYGAYPEQELLWDDYALFFSSVGSLITSVSVENGCFIIIKFDRASGKASEWILAASTYAHVPSDAALSSMAVVHFVAICFLNGLTGFYPERRGAARGRGPRPPVWLCQSSGEHELGRQAQCVGRRLPRRP